MCVCLSSGDGITDGPGHDNAGISDGQRREAVNLSMVKTRPSGRAVRVVRVVPTVVPFATLVFLLLFFLAVDSQVPKN